MPIKTIGLPTLVCDINGFRLQKIQFSVSQKINGAKKTIQTSGKFDAPIAVQTVPFTTFFPAEEYHQDYYKKSAFRYNLYKEGSGRAGFIKDNAQLGITLPPNTQYQIYDDALLARLTGSRILLFFHADWCSTCKSFDEQIRTTQLP